MNAPTALLIGCGKMGQALLHGWVKQNCFSSIDVVDPHGQPTGFENLPSVSFFKDSCELKKSFDIIVIAVKPQVINEVLKGCAGFEKALFLSIAAGKSVASLKAVLGEDKRIVRAMPNTPASIGKGISVLYADKNVTQADRALVETTLKVSGLVEWIEDEELMHAVTALSGSGPAYVFGLIESMSKAGEVLGLNKDFATNLARQTVIGAAALAEAEADKTAEELRQAVTSPGGTTEAALSVLMDKDDGLERLMTEALKKATVRSKELS